MNLIRSFDIFPKYADDVKKRTRSGGIIAVVSFVMMGILFILRFNSWVNEPLIQDFVLDSTDLHFKPGTREITMDNIPQIDINFDIVMYHLPCSYLHTSVIDVIKDVDESQHGRVRMQRIDPSGNLINKKPFPKEEEPPEPGYCGSCYGIRNGCCNTCKEVRKAFKAKNKPLPPIATIEQCTREGYLDELKSMLNESCRLYGSLSVSRHPGTFIIAPGDDADPAGHAYERIGVNLSALNLSHKINHFSLGESQMKRRYPLDDRVEIQQKNGKLKMVYYIRAVPIGQSPTNNYFIAANWYQNYRSNTSQKFPQISFTYDISPIAVTVSKKSGTEFFVEISGILGGIFALATLFDSASNKCHKDEILP